MNIEFLTELNAFERPQATLPQGSYTSKMFQKGQDAILQKVVEEAGEVVIAAKNTIEMSLR